MARKRTYTTPPRLPMNQWVRDALAHSEARGVALTFDQVATALTAACIGQSYDRSMVQKMTTIRDVKASEARVIATLTGYPVDTGSEGIVSIVADLSPDRRAMVERLVADLAAADAADRQADK